MGTVNSILQKSNKKLIFFSCFLILGVILIYLFVVFLGFPKRVGEVAFGTLDMEVYFNSSQWVVGSGRLYREVLSEYPPLANAIFGCIRFFSEKISVISAALDNYIWIWMTISWCIYTWFAFQLYTRPEMRKFLWLLCTPSVLYFTLYRYDIYPALFTFLALSAIKKDKYHTGSLWLGIAIALKGYALFLLPIYLLYVNKEEGKKYAIKTTIFCLAPFILSHLFILFISGIDGVIAPYLFHEIRGLNGESTYDVFIHFSNLRSLEIISDYPQITRVLQFLAPFLLMLFIPQSFDDLVAAFLLIILWFISFSIFYSPQFILWIFPMICFIKSSKIFYLSLPFSIITFLYYPLSSGSEISMQDPLLFVTIIRFVMIYICFRQLWKNRVTLNFQKLV